MELVGKLLGNRYEIVEKVGVGGMASVYKAKDKTLNRYVAIKVLKDEYANDQEFIKRFQIEAQSAASLSHPNIVSIYDVANDNNIHYIVMELIEGETLKEVIKEKGKLPWEQACEIASQIASGLSVAHKNHIIHRDIKPHNIIMTKDNLAKITDFGIAKAASSSTINASASDLGSVHYFSPEHARGGYTDEKSDIYSLGVVLYEMVTGKLPFDGDTAISVAMKHIKETPKAPIDINPNIPKGLNDIILKAMQKEVGSRYSSAGDMYKDIQKVIKSPDTANVGHVNSNDELFATQKVPVINKTTPTRTVNSNVTKENINNSKTKKKKKKNYALIVLVRILILIGLFALCVFGGMALTNNLFGEEKKNTVPNVVGYEIERARAILSAAGFEMEENSFVSSDLPKNYIVKQKYSSGEEVAINTKIPVDISIGQEEVEIPDLVGFTIRSATTLLEQRGLQILVEEEENDEVLAGKIFRQVPEAKEKVIKGDIVTVFVSTGSKEGIVQVPDLSTYDSEQVIKDALETLGLVPYIQYIEKEGAEDGAILSQSPEADKEVKTGTEVYVIINKVKIDDEPISEINPIDEPTGGEPTPGGNSSTPTPPTPQTPATGEKEMTILLSNLGEKETFNVRVVINGDIKGRSEIYNGTHSRKEGVLVVKYPADATGKLVVYVDGKLSTEQPIE